MGEGGHAICTETLGVLDTGDGGHDFNVG